MTAYHVHSLTLYCDNRKLPNVFPEIELKRGQHYFCEFPKEYLGNDTKECINNAKIDGWRFYKDTRTLCPRCVKSGIKLKKLAEPFKELTYFEIVTK